MKVFISHSNRDREFAEHLAAAMKADNFLPWLCEISISPSTNWVSEINKGLRDADIVLLLWSPDAASSVATELEWTSALAREIAERRARLGIVMLHDCELPELLRTKQYIDARRDKGSATDAVLQWLGERRNAGRIAGSRATVYLPDYRADGFVGRRDYLNKLRAALVDQPGMFLLSGEPGAGKSTIGLMFGLQAQRDFDAVVFQICGQRKAEAIIGELAGQLKNQLGEEVGKASPKEKTQAVKSWLKDRQSLLVLDDVWLDSSGMTAAELQEMLPGAPVAILFTSRLTALPKLRADQILHVDAFTQEEAEIVFRNYLPAAVVDRYRELLLEFAERVERLPIAVTVGAELLRNQFGPLGEAARGMALANLKNEIQDVPGLLQRAIEAQGGPERRLLFAATVCAPDGFWLPLAFDIAGLNKAEGSAARDNLVNASLVRVLDQERQRFQLHSLIREQARSIAPSLEDLQQGHAQALEHLFKNWGTRWRECRECLQEIIPAAEVLWNAGEVSRASQLNFAGSACGVRIGELDVSLDILQREESFWKDGADNQAKYKLQASYGNQALILRRWGRLEEAMALHKKEEEICLELGDKDQLQYSFGNRALILHVWGRLDEAMALHKKEEEICRELGNKDSLQRSYGNQALILHSWGRLDEAMALHKKEEEICRELGNRDSLQRSYGNQALILKDWGRLDEALALHKKQEEICLELGNKDSLQISYGNQALILKAWGRLDEALVLLKKQEEICPELRNKNSLQISYGNQALILHSWGRLDEALALLKKQEEICLELGNQNSLQTSYGNQALILKAWGRLDEAWALLKKQEEICLELGNKDSLQRGYGNQALILQAWRQLDETLALLRKQEEICLELGNKQGLGHCYWNWGLLARDEGNHNTEKQKLEAALAIFTELKMPGERDAVRAEVEKSKEKAEGESNAG